MGEKKDDKTWIQFFNSLKKQRKKQGGRPHVHKHARLKRRKHEVDRLEILHSSVTKTFELAVDRRSTSSMKSVDRPIDHVSVFLRNPS